MCFYIVCHQFTFYCIYSIYSPLHTMTSFLGNTHQLWRRKEVRDSHERSQTRCLILEITFLLSASRQQKRGSIRTRASSAYLQTGVLDLTQVGGFEDEISKLCHAQNDTQHSCIPCVFADILLHLHASSSSSLNVLLLLFLNASTPSLSTPLPTSPISSHPFLIQF